MRMSLAAAVLAILFGFCVAPLAYAQDVEEAAQLRIQIRQALLSDPRSATLSEGELAAIVEALADETEREGVVYDFLPPRPVNSFQSFVEGITTPWGQPVSEPVVYGIVLFCLALAFLFLKKVFDHHQQRLNAGI